MAGHSEGSFRVCDSFVEAAILRDMVRSTVINAGGKLSVDEMVDVIMRIFIDGIRRTSSPLVGDEVSKVPS